MAPPPSYPATTGRDDDLYDRQHHMEVVEVQEEHVENEQAKLKRALLRAQEEVKRIQSEPLLTTTTRSSNYYLRVISAINRELRKPSASLAPHRRRSDVLPPEAASSVSPLGSAEEPDVPYVLGETLI
ncbi:unnamed protein product [Alopecurus aequalis]